ncbi:helix-turn-helix domain-containing protein [Streptomyces sp. NPDC020883]|uniref:helix-turn-helix domain-containing protein n=1 Tax=Streptomyces sp. NPDC020883 TaxID=3365099 RepID=UPI0037B0771C
MSDTTPDSNHTPHATTVPEPLTGLTGAQAAVYTELLTLTEPTTVTELAHAAGVGRSTTGMALTTLEKRGLAARIPGGHDGPRRTPDLWHPTPDDKPTDDGDVPAPSETEPSPSTTNAAALTTADAPESEGIEVSDGKDTVDDTAPVTLVTQSIESEPQPDTPTPDTDDAHSAAEQPEPKSTHPVPDIESANPATGQESDAGQSTPSQKDEHDKVSGKTSAPLPITEPHTTPEDAATAPLSEKRRLAPGALRQMVIDHLQAHPGEAFTATKISRAIEKSSGAIANSLATLVRLGIAEKVSDTPRTFRLADATPATNIQ